MSAEGKIKEEHRDMKHTSPCTLALLHRVETEQGFNIINVGLSKS